MFTGDKKRQKAKIYKEKNRQYCINQITEILSVSFLINEMF